MYEEVITAAGMRAVERAAIGSGAVSGAALMERAGAGAVEAILAWRPAFAEGPASAAVLCGPGANGGDGFIVARLLAERGWDVEAILVGAAAGPDTDAAQAQRGSSRLGATAALPAPGVRRRVALVVDAVFGTGLDRPIADALWRDLAAFVAASGEGAAAPIVALDAPSGLCLDSGRFLGAGYFGGAASLTTSFHAAKRGHVLAEGPAACGRLAVVDIGLGPWREAAEASAMPLARPGAPHRRESSHKYAHGHALVLAGGVGRGGAARLAARAALRVGAGLVTVAAPPAAIIENAARLDAIMLRPLRDAPELTEALKDRRITAVALGMGLGVGARTRELAMAALAAGRCDAARAAPDRAGPRPAVVLDADALTGFADEPAALWEHTHAAAALTPHMGEFAALFPDLAERLHAPALRGPAFSRVDAAREAARRAGCVVLLKGPDTVIADPHGAVIHAALYARAAPWLATAGAGDVLAGLIAGLCARGWPVMKAAESAAWLHVEAARRFGPGLVAEDLPEALPGVLGQLAAPGAMSRTF